MCLAIINTTKPKKYTKIQYGYKWMDYSNFYKEFNFPFRARKNWIKKNEWLTDNKNTPIFSLFANKNYPTGFHIYLNLDDAMNECNRWYSGVVVKIWFKNVVAIGKNSKQDIGQTVIAKNMKISKIIYKYKNDRF